MRNNASHVYNSLHVRYRIRREGIEFITVQKNHIIMTRRAK